jgi:hypothetical protein
MLILPLLFCAHTTKMFFTWHRLVFSQHFLSLLNIGVSVVFSQYRKLLSIKHSMASSHMSLSYFVV